jgi:hypothetical protein
MSITPRNAYLLNFGSFDLEFDVDLDASVDETRVFGASAPADFFFAVGSIWVRHNDSRYLVSGEFNTGNLAEWLNIAALRFSNAPPLPPNMLASAASGVCQWFLGYWDRVKLEITDESDEATYDCLFPYCIISENNGCMAVFAARELAVVQVCAQEATVARPICFETRLQGSHVASRMEALRASIAVDVRTHSKRH